LQLKRIYVDNFRNLCREEIQLNPGINIVLGKNAQGKTNFLEAIYILASATSPRTNIEQEMVAWENDYYFIKGEVESQDDTFAISVGYTQGKKRIRVNENPLERVKDLLGRFMVIFFGPEDLQLIKGSPQLRRQFLDREISLLQPLYYENLQRYRTVLAQRNNLLKEIGEKGIGESELEPWDEQLADLGGELITRRIRFLNELKEKINSRYAEISGEEVGFKAEYEPSIALDKKSSSQDWKRAFIEAWKRRRKEEIIRGVTILGPHRDDLSFRLGDRELKNYGSQGQQRTAVLALKIGELELMTQVKGEQPVLLLDDVFSELDGTRQKALLDLIGGNIQSIITTTENNFQEIKKPCYYFTVDKGKINRWEGRN